MIKIEDLSVAFDGTEVVKNITIEINDGEIVGVVGESGSGKSVTALTLMGFQCRTLRMPLTEMEPKNIIRLEYAMKQLNLI